MTQQRDLDRVLDRWMDDGPTAVADRVIAAAMTDVHTTRQIGARWAPLKECFMSIKPTTIGLGLTAAMILAAAVFVASREPTTVGPPDATPDLAAIVVTRENVPEGWTVDATRRGNDVLAFVVRFGQVSDATDGFLDGRASDFCAEGEGCGTSWVALYRSEAEADAAFSVLHGEMLVGWGLGPHPRALDLGEDEGYAYRNNMGNATASHAYLWRNGNLLLGVIGDMADLEGDPLRPVITGMNARMR